MSTSPTQSAPERNSKRQSYQLSANPIVCPGGNSVHRPVADQSCMSPLRASPQLPQGQPVRSQSDFTLSPAHLLPPPPSPSSALFWTPQSIYLSSPSSQTTYFGPYADYPTNPYLSDISYAAAEWTADDAMGYLDFDAGFKSDMDAYVMSQSHVVPRSISTSDFGASASASISMAFTSPFTALTSAKTPRPPNAWILYRSDKLKAITPGEVIPGLDEIAAEIKPASTASPSNELTGGEYSSTKKSRRRVPKKGSQPATQGMLSLGKGKLGRGLPQADISRMISLLWKRDSPAVRDKYEQMALFKKQEHQLKYPDYKFQPQRKADKRRAREERREREAVKKGEEAQKDGRAKRTRSKKNRCWSTAPSSRTGPQPDYAPPIGKSSKERVPVNSLRTPATETTFPLLCSNPVPVPPLTPAHE